MTKGILLRCYVVDDQWHHGQPVWECLIQQANRMGIRGGSAFRAMAGFGHQHVLHEGPRLFDLHAPQTVEVEFLVTEAEVLALLQWAEREGIRLFHATTSARFGIAGTDDEPDSQSTSE